MKRAIVVHRQDFAAVISLVIAAVAVVLYVLLHQPAFTFGSSYYTVKAPFATGSAVIAGQGQAVDVAGVQVGQVGGISLHNGQAVVTMNIFKKYAPIYRDATVLLRPRTPLKDMYLALDPGTPDAGRIPDNGSLAIAATSPDVDTDQILSSLDQDTRDYLLLLLAGGADVFRAQGDHTSSRPDPQAVADLQATFKRFAPLNRDTRTFTLLLQQRRRNIMRSIHNLQELTKQVGSVNGVLASLIRASDTNFSAISSQDANLQSALTLLPGTFQQTTTTLGKVQAFAAQSGVTLQALLPFAHAFGPALAAARPLFRDTTSVLRDQLRPFAVKVQPVARLLAPAARKLALATPHLSAAVAELNTLFNELAYQPPGTEQGYLFWGSWLSHITDSLVATQDAQGPIVRGVFMATCGALNLFEVALTQSDPALGPLVDLLNAPDWSKIKSKFCPQLVAP